MQKLFEFLSDSSPWLFLFSIVASIVANLLTTKLVSRSASLHIFRKLIELRVFLANRDLPPRKEGNSQEGSK